MATAAASAAATAASQHYNKELFRPPSSSSASPPSSSSSSSSPLPSSSSRCVDQTLCFTHERTADRDYLYHHFTLTRPSLSSSSSSTLKFIIAAQLDGSAPRSSSSSSSSSSSESAAIDESNWSVFDPYFFDPGYTLAAVTGFSVWEGSISLFLFFASTFIDPSSQYFERIASIRRDMLNHHHRTLELGSGTGMAGIGLSVLGANIMCTDISAVCNITRDNIQRNLLLNPWKSQEEQTHTQTSTPTPSHHHHSHNDHTCNPSSLSAPWKGSSAIGVSGGHVMVEPLDWSESAYEQSNAHLNDPRSAALIVAADTAWLADLAPLFVKTVSDLLHSPLKNEHGEFVEKQCVWVYRERGTETSTVFTTMAKVKQAFLQADCIVTEVFASQSKEDPLNNNVVNIITVAKPAVL